MSNGNKPKQNIASKFRKIFNSVPKKTTNEIGLESTGAAVESLSNEDITDKAGQSRQELYRIIEQFLGNDTGLKKIADKIAIDGKEALKAVADDNSDYLEKNPQKSGFLEVIVRTDGSRPSFLIQDGKVNKDSSPISTWSDVLDASGECLTHAISCVGRINNGAKAHIGTGFLIHQDLIITNRHVLQEIANKENNGKWLLKPGTHIDFGYEFRAQKSITPRNLEEVIFCPDKYIDPYNVDHSKLDLVIIRLNPVDRQSVPLQILSFGIAPEWAEENSFIYTIGYPGNPGLAGLQTYTTLLEQLFKSTFGYKRLAPGMVISSSGAVTPFTVTHDATTLGGNSGSVIVAQGNACVAAGLHYGGDINAPRENWGHILANTLNSQNTIAGKTLKECLSGFGVKMTDTFS
jgi:V8-like Glu-specific endopeptidase